MIEVAYGVAYLQPCEGGVGLPPGGAAAASAFLLRKAHAVAGRCGIWGVFVGVCDHMRCVIRGSL